MAENSSSPLRPAPRPSTAPPPFDDSPRSSTSLIPPTSATRIPEQDEGRDPILVRYFASAAEAAGRDEEILPAVKTVGELRAVLIASHGDAMARVLRGGSFLVDGVVSRDDSRSIGQRVDVLPPFAGG